MATAISPLAFFSAGAAATTGAIVPKPSQTPPLPKPLIPVLQSNPSASLSSLTAPISAIAVAAILSTTPPSLADTGGAFSVYYGTAASAANYGGFGGNASKKDSAEYIYDVPEGWKERLVSKVEKGISISLTKSLNSRALTANFVSKIDFTILILQVRMEPTANFTIRRNERRKNT